jgi:hypothetical protein
MGERRPLAAAVNTFAGADPADVRAFITQERKQSPVVPEVELNASAGSEAKPVEQEREASVPGRSSGETAVRPPKRRPTRLQPVGLIPVTIRLRPEIAGALKRASLERQLEGEETFTQQDLVERALEPWLIEEGYIRSSN